MYVTLQRVRRQKLTTRNFPTSKLRIVLLEIWLGINTFYSDELRKSKKKIDIKYYLTLVNA